MTQEPFSKSYQEFFCWYKDKPLTEAQKRFNANWHNKQYMKRRKLIEEHDGFTNTLPLEKGL